MVNNNSSAASGGFDIKHSNVDLGKALSRGYPRSFRGVKGVNVDMYPIEHRVKDESEHLYYNDKKRRIGYDGRLLRDNAAEDKLLVHSLNELGSSGDDWSSLNGRVTSGHKINTNYTIAISNYMGDSDLRRTVHDANLVVRV
ncbi:hypothetical protein K7X08_019994 [Anisodus acutangulus]|uniref:Uncharacterized protein n=1 Tax=Anisodus acutangulus TaxID=402998 RepID=A0A9Q1MW05_9SOLA|nr:hypothetical protein K7X08_019994 [Anisodus acutangulus]